MSTTSAELRWIVDGRTDALVFFGVPAAIGLLGVLLVAQPALVVPVFWFWLLCIDGPHLVVTGLRSGFDRTRAAQEAAWRRRGWWVVALPLAAWLGALAWPQARSMELLLAVGVLYSWYHLTRQHEGVLAIYHAQTRAGTPLPAAAPERLWLRGWLWCAFVLSAVLTPANRAAWLAETAPGDAQSLRAGFDAAALLSGAATLVCIAGYLRIGLQRRRSGASLRPWWFGLLPVGVLSSFALLGVGWWEPLYGAAHTREDTFLAVTLMTGLLHGTQYLAIVLAANRRRHAGAGGGWVARLAARPGLTLAIAVAFCLGFYFVLNIARGTLPGPRLFDMASPVAQFAMALYWAIFFHHYHVDSQIWRVGRDAALRRELNIA